MGSRYEGREVNVSLNQLLYDQASGFARKIGRKLDHDFGYQIGIYGSLAELKAIHKRGPGWFIKDVDFMLTNPEGNISFDKAMKVRLTPWFFTDTQHFLSNLDRFYKKNRIGTNILEVDYIYDTSFEVPLAFAIGKHSQR